MRRRQFGREFKIEAVRLIKDHRVSVAQASRDLDVHENQLRKWMKLFSADPAQAFPGHGQMKPEQLEIEKLRREVAKLKAERDLPQEPDALVHHSDQGSQYTNELQKLMADNGVTCSMSRSGNAWDNAAMESLLAASRGPSGLAQNRADQRQVYRTRDGARADVFDYIERFYNAVRRHSTIGPGRVRKEGGSNLTHRP